MKAVSSSEIAKVLGLTTRAIHARAKRESWLFIEVPGRGRGGKVRFFPLLFLPLDVRAAFQGQEGTSVSASVNSRPMTCHQKGLSRFVIVEQARKIRTQSGRCKKKALGQLAKDKGISLSTIYTYLKDADRARETAQSRGLNPKAAQVDALTPNYGTRSRKFAAFSKEALDYAKLLYGPPNLLSITDVFKRTIQEAERKGWKTGSYEALRRYFYSTVEENVAMEILKQAKETVKWATALLRKKELKSISEKWVKLRKQEKELF